MFWPEPPFWSVRREKEWCGDCSTPEKTIEALERVAGPPPREPGSYEWKAFFEAMEIH